MKNEKNLDLVNKYFDRELDKNQEMFLFSQLSSDERAREYFKNHSLLSNGIKQTEEIFPMELDERILVEVNKTGNRFLNKEIVYRFSFAVLIILFAISSFFFYSEKEEYKSRLNSMVEKVNDQNQLINVLFNTLPIVEVVSKAPNLIVIEGNRS